MKVNIETLCCAIFRERLPESRVAAKKVSDGLVDAIQKLPEPYKSALHKRFVEGKKVREVGLGLPSMEGKSAGAVGGAASHLIDKGIGVLCGSGYISNLNRYFGQKLMGEEWAEIVRAECSTLADRLEGSRWRRNAMNSGEVGRLFEQELELALKARKRATNP